MSVTEVDALPELFYKRPLEFYRVYSRLQELAEANNKHWECMQ